MLRTLFAILTVALIAPSQGLAQLDSRLASISPSATDVSNQIPALPQRISAYGFRGVSGTTYSVRFEVTPQPALVVAVGAEISGMSYDDSLGVLDLSVDYSGEAVIADSRVTLPDSSFFLFLDEGADPAASERAAATTADKSSSRCYGPGADLSRFEQPEGDGDFGDDDGLADPPPPAAEDDGAGFPQTARGAFASTNSFLWCSVRPDGTVRFEIAGPQNRDGRLSLFLPDSFIASVRGEDASSIQASRFAVFALGNQISVNAVDSGAGVLAKATVPLEEGRFRAQNPTMAAVATAAERRAELRALADSSLGRKQLSLGEREAVSAAPGNSIVKPVDSTVEIFGFVADPALVGSIVEIIRFDPNGCVQSGSVDGLDFGIQGFTGTIVSRTPVQSDGSYSSNLPSTTVFPQKNSKKAQVAARVTGDVTRQSRQVSLSKKSRKNRR